MSYAASFAALPARTRVKKKISEVFDIDAPDHALIDVYTERTQFVPEIDPTYVFDKKRVKKMLQWLSGRYKKNLLLTGPTGCGKSSIVEQVCARLGIEVFRVACHGKLEFSEILGSNQLVNASTVAVVEEESVLKRATGAIKGFFKGPDDGESLLTFLKRLFSTGVVTQYVYGPAVNAAARFEGGVLLMDEGNFLHPSTFGALNTVLDNGPLLIPETGENIVPKPGFRIAVTGNAMNGDDSASLHKGIQKMNVALMNRFLVMNCDYIDAVQEAKIIAKTVRLPVHVITTMVQTARDARDAFTHSIIETVISTRTLVTWAKLVHDDPAGLKADAAACLSDALDFALLDGANPVDAEAIKINLNKSIEKNPAPVQAPVAPRPSTAAATTTTSGTGQFAVNFLVSENNGSPKVWGMYIAPGSNEETIFYGALTGTLKEENKSMGYFTTTRPTKLNPGASKSPYLEISSFSSTNASSDLAAIQKAYKLLISGSRPTLSPPIAKAMSEVLPAINRQDLLASLPATV